MLLEEMDINDPLYVEVSSRRSVEQTPLCRFEARVPEFDAIFSGTLSLWGFIRVFCGEALYLPFYSPWS
jgi:hypothetical protein